MVEYFFYNVFTKRIGLFVVKRKHVHFSIIIDLIEVKLKVSTLETEHIYKKLNRVLETIDGYHSSVIYKHIHFS